MEKIPFIACCEVAMRLVRTGCNNFGYHGHQKTFLKISSTEEKKSQNTLLTFFGGTQKKIFRKKCIVVHTMNFNRGPKQQLFLYGFRKVGI